MSLIVEDGTIIADAESYISVADTSAYHLARGDTTWATISTAQKEEALRRATDYMLQVYRHRWKGVRMSSTQTLDWPRAYVYLEPVITGANQEFPTLVADNIVPAEVKRACAQMALRAAAGDLYADQARAAIRNKVGPIEVEYSAYGPLETRYASIDAMLQPYMAQFPGTVKAQRA